MSYTVFAVSVQEINMLMNFILTGNDTTSNCVKLMIKQQKAFFKVFLELFHHHPQ